MQDINNYFENLQPKDVPSPEEFIIFKRKISSLINLDLSSYKSNQMERRVTSLMHRNSIGNLTDYYNLLVKDSVRLNEFINMLTINVTEFFRNPEKFQELETKYIPELLERSDRLKIWSSGCSIGAEIYTLAMLLEKMNILEKCTLIASDFDQNAINKAKEGIYTRFELKNLLEMKDFNNLYMKYFKPIDDKEEKFQINQRLTAKVRFEKRDLLNSKFEMDFDLILCRNVVIYFTEEAKDQLYANFYKSLKPGGILFIGSTERINKYKEIGLNLCSSFFYQK